MWKGIVYQEIYVHVMYIYLSIVYLSIVYLDQQKLKFLWTNTTCTVYTVHSTTESSFVNTTMYQFLSIVVLLIK